jgi:hypothetical protein
MRRRSRAAPSRRRPPGSLSAPRGPGADGHLPPVHGITRSGGDGARPGAGMPGPGPRTPSRPSGRELARGRGGSLVVLGHHEKAGRPRRAMDDAGPQHSAPRKDPARAWERVDQGSPKCRRRCRRARRSDQGSRLRPCQAGCPPAPAWRHRRGRGWMVWPGRGGGSPPPALRSTWPSRSGWMRARRLGEVLASQASGALGASVGPEDEVESSGHRGAGRSFRLSRAEGDRPQHQDDGVAGTC